MKKKLIMVLLTASLLVSMLAGCTKAVEEESVTTDPVVEETTTETEEATTEEEAVVEEPQDIADITVSLWSLGAVPAEVTKVEEAINAITEKEIGVHVKLNILDVGSYIPKGAMSTGVANGEDFDVVLTAPALSGHFSPMYSNGMLMPLDDLLKEYGQDILATVPKEMMDATTRGGQTFAVPVYGNKVKNMYWVVRREAAEKAGIDMATIKTAADIEAALLKIKETSPDMMPLGGSARTTNLTYPGFALGSNDVIQSYDVLGESTARAVYVDINDSTLTAKSYFESDACKNDVELLKKWFDLGLIDKDVATDTATSSALAEKPNVASVFSVTQINLIGQLAQTNDAVYAKIASGIIATGGVLQFTWALPVSCDEPEASMKFMNMLFSDERIVNLVDYGIEDVHYVAKEDGTVGFPEGMTRETSGYFLGGISELVGNAYLAKIWEGGNPDSHELGKTEMENAIYSPLMGFALDVTTVADTYAQLTSIAGDEYGPFLFSGSAPDGFYDELIEKIKASGLEAYTAEANRQIQAFLADK